MSGHPPNEERRATPGFEYRLHRRELGGLVLGHVSRADVSGDGLEQCRRGADQEPDLKRPPVEGVHRIAEEEAPHGPRRRRGRLPRRRQSVMCSVC